MMALTSAACACAFAHTHVVQINRRSMPWITQGLGRASTKAARRGFAAGDDFPDDTQLGGAYSGIRSLRARCNGAEQTVLLPIRAGGEKSRSHYRLSVLVKS